MHPNEYDSKRGIHIQYFLTLYDFVFFNNILINLTNIKCPILNYIHNLNDLFLYFCYYHNKVLLPLKNHKFDCGLNIFGNNSD